LRPEQVAADFDELLLDMARRRNAPAIGTPEEIA